MFGLEFVPELKMSENNFPNTSILLCQFKCIRSGKDMKIGNNRDASDNLTKCLEH